MKARTSLLLFGLVGGLVLALESSSFAVEPSQRSVPVAPSYEEEEGVIPRKPSMPQDLGQRPVPEIPHCERYFVYQGKKMECDSSMGGDAEMLRPIMKDVPPAIAELDAYRSAQKNVRIAAYVGSAGFLAAIIGVSRPMFDQNGGLLPAGYVAFGGLALAANALIYGLSLVKTNEVHIGNAVRIYNSVHPDKPVVLQFSTQVHF